MKSEEILLLQRRIERERQSRKEAERILEIKALELYKANQELLSLNNQLENEVELKTIEYENSKKRYQQIVEFANDIIFECDQFGNVIYANPVSTRILYYTNEELLKMHFSDLIATESKQATLEFYFNLMKKGIAQSYYEFPIVKKDGKIAYIGQHVHLDMYELNGYFMLNGFRAVSRDITENHLAQLSLKLSEEKYRRIMENMNLGFLEINNQGYIIRVYQALCDMTGYTENELIGKSAEEILIPIEFQDSMKEQSIKRNQGEVSAYEMQLIKKNGDRLWVLISGGPVFNQNGEVIGSVGIHYDISNLKKIQTELAEAKELAEASQKAEQEFLANMSHEIRTPLNAVIGMAHLLYYTDPTPQQVEYLDIIKNSASFLHALISDILDMAKIEARKIEIKNSEFDILAVLKTLHRTYELKTQGKNLKVLLDIDPNLNTLVIGDEIIFNQILNNLLSNAEKFTETGTIKISARIDEKLTDSKTKLCFAVEDSGHGMEDSKAKLVFQKFKQIHDKNSSKTKGTGLGLAIVKELIELQGGSITLKTVLNHGSTFFFDLPFTITDKKISTFSEREFDDNLTVFKDTNILIAEDNAMNFKYLSTLLSRWNINYKYALDGQEAVLLSDKYKFDLVLMDIQMPKMDGYEATTQIRSQSGPNQNIPIIALTASALVIEKDKAKLVGMDGVLTKPFTPDQLKHTLNKYLRNDFSNNTIKSETISMETIPIDKQLNQDILIEYFGNDKDFKKMVFETFVEDIDFQIDEFKSLFMEKQWENIAKLAHKMKPSFSMVGLKHTEQLLKSIESGIKTQGINDIIINQAETFISSFPEIFNLVKTELKNI